MGIPMAGGEWLKLILILFTGFLYFGLFLILSIFMSVITKQSSISLLFMLVIWISTVIVIPRVSVLIAGRAVNVPTVDEINEKKIEFSHAKSQELMKKFREPAGAARPARYKHSG